MSTDRLLELLQELVCLSLLRAVYIALHRSKRCKHRSKGLLGRIAVGSHGLGAGLGARRGVGVEVGVV